MKLWIQRILLAGLALTAGIAFAREPEVLDLTGDRPEQAVTLQLPAPGSFWAWKGPKVLSVYSVDDVQVRKVSGIKQLWQTDFVIYKAIKFLPGKHRVAFKASQGSAYGGTHLWFVAEPGKEYVARMEFRRNTYRVWIEETQSGLEVGGLVGSSDEPLDAPAPTKAVSEAASEPAAASSE